MSSVLCLLLNTDLRLLLEVKSYRMWTTLKLFSKTFRVSWAFSLRSSSWRISDTNSSQSEETENIASVALTARFPKDFQVTGSQAKEKTKYLNSIIPFLTHKYTIKFSVEDRKLKTSPAYLLRENITIWCCRSHCALRQVVATTYHDLRA